MKKENLLLRKKVMRMWKYAAGKNSGSIPDEKTTFYGLCSLFVNQVYTKLVELADSKGGRLKIRTNFILDEFGNFSAIPNFR